MKFEALQKVWQSHDAGARVTINAGLLLKEVRRNQRQLRATIFWRDAREVSVTLLLTLYFSCLGLRHHKWTDYLAGLACFGVGTFMVADRLLQRRKEPAANDSLKTCVESSLRQVNHQIWLLKNIIWWYLLPLAAGACISLIGAAEKLLLEEREGRPALTFEANGLVIGSFAVVALVCGLLFWGVYRLNQCAVRKDLEPRRQELETLLASLKENPQ